MIRDKTIPLGLAIIDAVLIRKVKHILPDALCKIQHRNSIKVISIKPGTSHDREDFLYMICVSIIQGIDQLAQLGRCMQINVDGCAPQMDAGQIFFLVDKPNE